MGFVIRKLPYKSRFWKLQYLDRTNGQSKATDIQETRYLSLGFSPSMSIDEARSRCKSLNSSESLKRIQEKRNGIDSRLKEEELKLNSALPEFFLTEFENQYVLEEKQKIQWRTTKRILTTLNIPIEDWCFKKNLFYNLFKEEAYSYSYIQKLIFNLNRWGKFIAYKQKSYFEPIPSPKGRDKEKLIDSYEDEYGSQASEPLTPSLLEAKKSCFKEEQFNWLYISVWLGLRPVEVDQLLESPSKTTWFLDDNVLWVYQTKLSGIAREKRLKPIPLQYPEQLRCLDLIKSGALKRPLNKSLKRHFNGQYTGYAGRKGFTDLMLSLGNSLEAISQWLGHKNINRTWKDYKDKKNVLLK